MQYYSQHAGLHSYTPTTSHKHTPEIPESSYLLIVYRQHEIHSSPEPDTRLARKNRFCVVPEVCVVDGVVRLVEPHVGIRLCHPTVNPPLEG